MATLTDLTNSIKGLHVHSVENVFPDYQGNVDIEIHKHNVGEEWHSYIGQVPVGGIAYLGQLVPKATYGALWAWVQSQDGLLKTEEEWQAIASTQNGNVPFYSTGDGDLHFRMPAIFGYIRGVGANDPAGTYIAEGLPNIEGTIESRPHSTGSTEYGGTLLEPANGAFSFHKHSGTVKHAGTGESNSSSISDLTIFDASKSNEIYGNSIHVTPETCMVLFGVWAFGEVTNIGQVELLDVVTDFENIRTTALYQTTPHITETWVNGTSWYRVWSDGYIEQGGLQNTLTISLPVTFPKPFTNANYTITAVSTQGEGVPRFYNRTTTGFTWQPAGASNTGYWHACGY